MQIEGISWQTDWNAVVGSYIDRRRSWTSDPLHRHALGIQSNLMFMCFLDNGIHQLLIGRVRIRSPSQCHGSQVVRKRVIGQLRWNDLKPGINRGDDDQKPDNCFERSHVPQSALLGRETRHLDRRSNSSKVSTIAVILTSRTSRVERRTTSTVPSVTFFPTVIRNGIPTKSASLNFTPGRSSRSSRTTSIPAASSRLAMSSAAARTVSSFTLTGATTTSSGAIVGGSQNPFSSLLCSTAAVRIRSIPIP